jgi:DNA polymerase-2
VLYGDTDSLFVETGLGDDAPYAAFAELCGLQAAALNAALGEEIRREYDLESALCLRFEKAYRRFLLPPLRTYRDGDEGQVGRAKGYAGSILGPGGSLDLEVKGMEAARRDVTALARRLQVELLELVFRSADRAALEARVTETIEDLRAGRLDGELVYRKRLSRPPEAYTATTPPWVKAARLLGWKGRRGTVEYVISPAGPQPLSQHDGYDYDHYISAQILPIARSIAEAAGWPACQRVLWGAAYSDNADMPLFAAGEL